MSEYNFDAGTKSKRNSALEKLSDVTQDYIKSGILDIIEVFGSYFPLDGFFGFIYVYFRIISNQHQFIQSER